MKFFTAQLQIFLITKTNLTTQHKTFKPPKTFNLGFTMIEVLIAIAIIGIVSAVAIPGLRNFNQSQELEVARAMLYDELRLAQSQANANIVCPNVNPNVISLEISWAVILRSTGYALQYTCIDNSASQPQTHTGIEEKLYPSGTSIVMSGNSCGTQSAKYNNSTVKFISRSCPASNTTCKTFEITCGDGSVYAFPSAPANSPFTITLKNNQNIEKKISISEGGAIYEQ